MSGRWRTWARPLRAWMDDASYAVVAVTVDMHFLEGTGLDGVGLDWTGLDGLVLAVARLSGVIARDAASPV